MVSVRSVVVALVALVVLALPAAALADTIGPACWNFFVNSGAAPAIPPRFSLLFHTDPSSPTTATVVGVTRFPGSPAFDPPVSGAALLYGDLATGVVSMGLTVAPSPGQSPQFINVQFPLSTLNGVGYCVGGYGACSDGRTLTWTSIPCTSF
jgi:hypothetical protein